jgi:hypothetical protein
MRILDRLRISFQLLRLSSQADEKGWIDDVHTQNRPFQNRDSILAVHIESVNSLSFQAHLVFFAVFQTDLAMGFVEALLLSKDRQVWFDEAKPDDSKRKDTNEATLESHDSGEMGFVSVFTGR